jgi:hypothetical protein
VKKSRLNRTTGLRRTPMPPRKTPLEGKRLSSSGLDSVDRTGFPAARSAEPMRPPVKQRRRDTGPRKSVADLARERFGDLCARCGLPGHTIQHRRPRQIGGSRDPRINALPNLVLLCGDGTTLCHGTVESHRTQAQADGYLVRWPTDPRDVPMLLWDGRRVLLTDDGLWTEVEAGAA